MSGDNKNEHGNIYMQELIEIIMRSTVVSVAYRDSKVLVGGDIINIDIDTAFFALWGHNSQIVIN